jgi:proliferating cell nuclear antigen
MAFEFLTSRLLRTGARKKMSFEATIEKASVFKKIIDAIKELVTNAKFECRAEGLVLQAMDNSHVSLVSLIMRADEFVDYSCERTLALGLNLETVCKALKSAGSDDSLTIKANEDGDTVEFAFKSKNGKKESIFQLKMLELDVDSLGIPDTEYNAVMTLSSSEFQKTCQNLSVWGEDVHIEATKKGVRFSVEGDSGSGNIFIKSDQADGVVSAVKNNVTLKFALPKICACTKATSLSDKVVLSMSSDVPLCIEYVLPGKLGSLKYHLAPKMDDDDTIS